MNPYSATTIITTRIFNSSPRSPQGFTTIHNEHASVFAKRRRQGDGSLHSGVVLLGVGSQGVFRQELQRRAKEPLRRQFCHARSRTRGLLFRVAAGDSLTDGPRILRCHFQYQVEQILSDQLEARASSRVPTRQRPSRLPRLDDHVGRGPRHAEELRRRTHSQGHRQKFVRRGRQILCGSQLHHVLPESRSVGLSLRLLPHPLVGQERSGVPDQIPNLREGPRCGNASSTQAVGEQDEASVYWKHLISDIVGISLDICKYLIIRCTLVQILEWNLSHLHNELLTFLLHVLLLSTQIKFGFRLYIDAFFFPPPF